MGWKETDERLIRRGELILDPRFLQNPEQELKTMNTHKRGPNYRMTNTYIQLLAAIRYIYQMPYRQLEGFTRALNRLVPTVHIADYSGIRKRILRLNVDPYGSLRESSEPVTIALDSSGVKVEKAGGWIERKHGKKKRYVKLHFAVNTETHEVVSMEVTTDDVHDSRAAPALLDGAERNTRVAEALMDSAYDSMEVYEELARRGIEAVIKPRANARTDTGPPSRGRAVGMILELGYATWSEFAGYGRRWAVETAYSTFKRLFGESAMGRSLGSIASELVGKVAIYNMLVNM
jgi:transposase